tara:strand:+ start:1352 stop:1480 length:129 start_codon:yes stop_codon:yes gene_type:complete
MGFKLMKKRKSKGVVWHIYHTILAIELAIVATVEVIELVMSL